MTTETNEQTRAYLADRYSVSLDCVKTGDEATKEEAGLYLGEPESWVVYGTMPNTNIEGWFFAGYSCDLEKEAR